MTSWLQPALHFEVTTAHALGGIVYAQFLLLIMYAFDRADMRFPALTALGRNLILMFLVGGVGTALYAEFLVRHIHRDILAAFPLGTTVLFAIIPYIVTIALGIYLDRKKIYVRV